MKNIGGGELANRGRVANWRFLSRWVEGKGKVNELPIDFKGQIVNCFRNKKGDFSFDFFPGGKMILYSDNAQQIAEFILSEVSQNYEAGQGI